MVISKNEVDLCYYKICAQVLFLQTSRLQEEKRQCVSMHLARSVSEQAIF